MPILLIPLAWWREDVVVVPTRIAALLVAFLILRWLTHKVINRLVRRAGGNGTVSSVLARSERTRRLVEPLLSERRRQRAETVGSLMKSTVTIVLATLVTVMVLDQLGFNVLPVIASASILGVALGFGAQALVKDFLSGIFMILEDQYGVGDVVDLQQATGVVEAVGLRVTRLRAEDGTIWYVRNGEVLRVGNLSNGTGYTLPPPGTPGLPAE